MMWKDSTTHIVFYTLFLYINLSKFKIKICMPVYHAYFQFLFCIKVLMFILMSKGLLKVTFIICRQ